jgi:predicted enzyme related to lactoylglutathione lyase
MFKSALVTIASRNFDLIVDFYSKFFAQIPDPYRPQVYAEFHLAGLTLGIFCPKSTNQAEFEADRPSRISICLEVTNLEREIERLHHLGYPPPGEIVTASHGREIYAYDPDHNRLILHQS